MGANGTEGASSATGYRYEKGGWPVLSQHNGRNKPYCELGKLLDALARSRQVQGPYNIAHHLKGSTGYEVSGQALSKYLYGKSVPRREFIAVFADAFELTSQEQIELAWVYAYGFPMSKHEEEEEGLRTHDGRLHVGLT